MTEILGYMSIEYVVYKCDFHVPKCMAESTTKSPFCTAACGYSRTSDIRWRDELFGLRDRICRVPLLHPIISPHPRSIDNIYLVPATRYVGSTSSEFSLAPISCVVAPLLPLQHHDINPRSSSPTVSEPPEGPKHEQPCRR